MKAVEYYSGLDKSKIGNNDNYIRNTNYYHSLYEKMLDDLQQLWTNRYEINNFTDILIDNNRLPININEYFSKIALRLFLHSIVYISQRLGTWASYKKFFTILFGEQCKITFERKMGKVLYLSVSNIDLDKVFWISKNNEIKQYFIDNNGKYIVFTNLFKGINQDRVEAFLRYISPFIDLIYFKFTL